MTINIPKQYINKLSFEYDSSLFSTFKIYMEKSNVYGELEEQIIDDKFMKDMPRSVVGLKGEIAKIEMEFPESDNQVKLWNISVDNSFKVNPLIMIFASCVFFLVGFYIAFKKENAEKPEIAVFVSIMIISTCLMVLQPPYIVGWDEQIHYRNSYLLGVTKTGETTSEIDDYMYGQAHMINMSSSGVPETIEERLDFIKVLNRKFELPGSFIDDYRISIQSIGYIFQAFALKIGVLLNLPFYLIWLMGKFANVLLYAFVMSYAVKIVPIGKRLLMVYALIPTMIFQSAMYTYDVTVIAFLTLAICILVKEIVCSDEVFRYRWRIAYLLCMFIGCMPKAVYAPLLLGGLFINKNKFYSDKDRKWFRFSVVLVFAVLMATFVLPVLISPAAVGDLRGGDTSEARQIQYVLGKPLAYAVILIKTILNTAAEYFLGRGLLSGFAYLGQGELLWYGAGLIIGVILTDRYRDERCTQSVLPMKYKTISMLQIAATIALIWTALYLSYTEVGYSSIYGVQSRYYFPFLYLFYLCFQTDKIEVHFPKEKYQLVVSLASAFYLASDIYNSIYREMSLN